MWALENKGLQIWSWKWTMGCSSWYPQERQNRAIVKVRYSCNFYTKFCIVLNADESYILFIFITFHFVSIPICRLWAEVFHVTTSSSGTVKWTQVSEDLVPVNITCIQDSPEVVFHITAYNSQVEKILDVRLLQPGKSKKDEVNAIRKNFILKSY